MKVKDLLGNVFEISLNYQSKFCTLVQSVILKDLINLMSNTLVDLDIEIRMKFSRIKYSGKKDYYDYSSLL